MSDIKFLIDESCGVKVVKALQEEAWNVVGIVGPMKGAKDEEVLKKACEEDRILITNDKDFGELIYHQKLPHKGVILLRLEGDFPEARFITIKRVVLRFQGKLKGKYVVATERKIRLR